MKQIDEVLGDVVFWEPPGDYDEDDEDEDEDEEE